MEKGGKDVINMFIDPLQNKPSAGRIVGVALIGIFVLMTIVSFITGKPMPEMANEMLYVGAGFTIGMKAVGEITKGKLVVKE